MDIQIQSKDIDFRQLIEYSLNSILIIEKEGHILYCNKVCLNLLNVATHEEVLHKSWYRFLHPDFHDVFKERLKRVLEEQEAAELIEQRIIRNDGEFIEIEVMSAPYYLGDEIFAQVIIQDITHRKLAEKLLNEGEKLSAIGQIAAGIAHEVKNPLTTVKGFLQLLKESRPHTYLDIMETELEKAFNTLQNLLQVSKPDLDDEPFVPIDICKELASLLFLFQGRLYNVEIEMDAIDSKRLIIGKRNLLLKALFNLIKNALEAVEDKGKIKIEHYFDEGYIHIKVSDTGVGIPEEQLKQLGNPFFSTKNEGTGLGLTQVFATIREHRGTISVQSIVGKGTTFHIKLPLN
ncbi:ATP-binding protein [Priestia megaterium]|jgi:two-component system, sporulation sensor kinase A|uniref:ATP-binding protein n=1 Tax=Priestia megaterium TaxID=1404 RepID=UPI001F149349|nr:ATP-binding protein [Priestia megaterium]UMZ36103.1 ATP-binding protein [Priestia megaterium]